MVRPVLTHGCANRSEPMLRLGLREHGELSVAENPGSDHERPRVIFACGCLGRGKARFRDAGCRLRGRKRCLSLRSESKRSGGSKGGETLVEPRSEAWPLVDPRTLAEPAEILGREVRKPRVAIFAPGHDRLIRPGHGRLTCRGQVVRRGCESDVRPATGTDHPRLPSGPEDGSLTGVTEVASKGHGAMVSHRPPRRESIFVSCIPAIGFRSR